MSCKRELMADQAALYCFYHVGDQNLDMAFIFFSEYWEGIIFDSLRSKLLFSSFLKSAWNSSNMKFREEYKAFGIFPQVQVMYWDDTQMKESGGERKAETRNLSHLILDMCSVDINDWAKQTLLIRFPL